MTKKKRIVAILAAVCAVAVAVVIFCGFRYKELSDTLSETDHIVMCSREEETENIRMYIQPDEWDIYPFEWLVSYKYQLNYMVYCTVVMKDGTEYEAYYYPYDDAFSLFGKDGFYAAKHTTVFKKY
ncbi:MAG: hypothetical protein IJO91_07950 [Oscillospiraceae bacterium]|nr:hypothetical protein [Oscillospiraceae bacterium]